MVANSWKLLVQRYSTIESGTGTARPGRSFRRKRWAAKSRVRSFVCNNHNPFASGGFWAQYPNIDSYFFCFLRIREQAQCQPRNSLKMLLQYQSNYSNNPSTFSGYQGNLLSLDLLSRVTISLHIGMETPGDLGHTQTLLPQARKYNGHPTV